MELNITGLKKKTDYYSKLEKNDSYRKSLKKVKYNFTISIMNICDCCPQIVKTWMDETIETTNLTFKNQISRKTCCGHSDLNPLDIINVGKVTICVKCRKELTHYHFFEFIFCSIECLLENCKELSQYRKTKKRKRVYKYPINFLKHEKFSEIIENKTILDQMVISMGKIFRNSLIKCFYCGNYEIHNTERLKVCDRCRNVSYCSRKCQKKDWKKHKKNCKTYTKLRSEKVKFHEIKREICLCLKDCQVFLHYIHAVENKHCSKVNCFTKIDPHEKKDKKSPDYRKKYCQIGWKKCTKKGKKDRTHKIKLFFCCVKCSRDDGDHIESHFTEEYKKKEMERMNNLY